MRDQALQVRHRNQNIYNPAWESHPKRNQRPVLRRNGADDENACQIRQQWQWLANAGHSSAVSLKQGAIHWRALEWLPPLHESCYLRPIRPRECKTMKTYPFRLSQAMREENWRGSSIPPWSAPSSEATFRRTSSPKKTQKGHSTSS